MCKLRVPKELKVISNPMFELIAHTVQTKWTDDQIKNYKIHIQKGESHEAYIYNCIVHFTGDKLESGGYHVYRGVLNDEGRLYHQLFEHAIHTMITKGEYTKEWADENLRAPVLHGIKEMG